MTKRIAWIQRAKALGILFIVLGHVVGGGYHLAHGDTALFLQRSYKYFYSFHVPFFFFLAGLTFSLGTQGFRAFLVRKTKRLLVPYFVFGVVSAFMYMIFSDGIFNELCKSSETSYYQKMMADSKLTPFLGLLHGGGWPNGNGFRSNSVLWFLPCLFTLETAYYVYERHATFRFRTAVAGILLLIAGYLTKNQGLGCLPWGVTNAIFYGLFFVVGRGVGATEWVRKDTAQRFGQGFLALALILFGGYLAIISPGQSILGKDIYQHVGYVSITCLSIAGWCLFSFCSQWRWLEKLGTLTLGIMLLHKFPVVALQTKVPVIREWYAGTMGTALVASVGIVAVSILCSVLACKIFETYLPWALGKRPSREAERG